MKQQTKLKVIAWGFAILIILAIPLCWFSWGWKRYREGVAMVQQNNAYRYLEKYISTNNKIPQKLTNISDYEKNLSLSKRPLPISYYPDAWKRPDKILFVTRLGDSYAVTFGNQSRAILIHWSYGGQDEDIILDSLGPQRYAPISIGIAWALAVIGAVVFFRFLNPSKKAD